MNKLVEDLLVAGGVTVPLSLSAEGKKEDPMSILESWLGVPGSKDFFAEVQSDNNNNDCNKTMMMMEDCAPFSSSFYQTLEQVLISAWRPKEATMIQSNVLMECETLDPKDMSLMVMESIRVTRALRYWMELNVVGPTHAIPIDAEGITTGENGDHMALTHFLFQHCAQQQQQDDDTETTEEQPSNKQQQQQQPQYIPLIQALYYHLEQLPQLLSQIHYFTQSLTKRSIASSGVSLTNPQSRLAQYQESQQIATRLNQEWEEHIERLEYIVGEWYKIGSPTVRRQCRAHLGSIWSQFVARSGSSGTGSAVRMENTTSAAIPMTLRILHRILQGSKGNKLEKAHEHLVNYHLIPLHSPNSMVLWRDQTSLLELYHEPLVQCIAILIQKRPTVWIPKAVAGLLEPDIWPKGGNTPKLVLLLHEIDTYLGLLPEPIQPNSLGDSFYPLLVTLGRCMASDHSRLAERALTFFKNRNFQTLVEQNFEQSLSVLLPFLVRTEPAWNPTVRKMTYHVLKTFQDWDEPRFLRMCDKVFPPSNVRPIVRRREDEGQQQSEPMSPPQSSRKGTAKVGVEEHPTEQINPKDFTLKAGMGSWEPPKTGGMRPPNRMVPRGGGRGGTGATAGRGAQPPLTVTGVAPWAMPSDPKSSGPSSNKNPPLTVTGVAPWAMSTAPKSSAPTPNKNPPLTVTGVAPWAMQKHPGPPPSGKRRAIEALPGVNESDALEGESIEEEDQGSSISDPPQSRVLTYMNQIKPPEEDEGASSWAKAQMAETPTLLPNLKFHDLVFGHDLGEGAFGSVRYARLIDRSKTRSYWPEYAVKIISTEKIKEMGYEASVQRELAVLRILSHPGIARLISSFRFREGVYLVLEYASGGDLHSLLRKNGSLDHDSTRFVIGEVVAALASIHELGLVYGDLKPENIVITEPGHVKLTDFGGCRPVTAEAKQLIESSAKNLLKQLRDGDWKPQAKKKEAKGLMAVDDDDDEEEEEDDDANDDDENGEQPHDDIRVEGTTAYLPPEVVMGAIPTISSDSWALGCVLFQCLSGRPPIMEADDEMTRHRIVSFDAKVSLDNDESDVLFQDKHASGINPDARDLIKRLLKRNAAERPLTNEIAQHDFFVKAGTDVFSLYRTAAHPLDVGDVSPVADAQWSRRQFSSIWAPQPQAYNLSLNNDSTSEGRRASASSGPIPEGEEATAFFSRFSTHPNNLRDISEKIPLPTPA